MKAVDEASNLVICLKAYLSVPAATALTASMSAMISTSAANEEPIAGLLNSLLRARKDSPVPRGEARGNLHREAAQA